MALTREQVEHVAELAKLGLTGDEIETYRHQLSDILDYAAILERLDTDSIAPTASVLPLQNVVREDSAAPSLSQDDVLANAPASTDGFFQVKAILDEEAGS
jgi:aspartyl-tRNA(Asn)/glutamyl-tRNA(Gln) amidotransferase subunit C